MPMIHLRNHPADAKSIGNSRHGALAGGGLALLVVFSCAGLAGCAHESILTRQTVPFRAELSDKEIPVPPPHVEVVNPSPIAPGEPLVLPTEVVGNWDFSAPRTVTQVEHKQGDTDQFLLYMGRPGPTDTPFVVITVAADQKSIAESDPATYKITGQRDYIMNGNVVHEWTGLMAGGAGFSELLIRRPGAQGTTGQTCHAMAVVKTPEEQKVAQPILGSLTWQPSR